MPSGQYKEHACKGVQVVAEWAKEHIEKPTLYMGILNGSLHSIEGCSYVRDAKAQVYRGAQKFMDKRMFITSGDSVLGAVLAEQASLDGWTVAATSKEDETTGGPGANPLIVNCKGHSFLSTRRSFIDCLNALGGIDAALVLHEAGQEIKPVHELTPVAIEEYIDIRMKDLFFVLREILSLFVRQRSGILAMVNYIPEDFTLLPLCAAATAAFRAVADSIATLYQNENIIINGFDCTNESPERYSRFILELVSGKAAGMSGRWYRCGGAGRRLGPRILRK